MAARFWVGGSGTWDNVSIVNWSATSGGLPLASVPTSADTVTFDSNSGTAATVTVAATATCSTCTVNKADINLSLSGSPTFVGTFTLTTGTVTLNTFTLTVLAFVSNNSNTRAIAFGTGNITLTNNNNTIWNTDTSTNLTVSGTPVVNSTYSGATGTRTMVFAGTAGGTEANSISVNVSAGTDIVGLYGNALRNVNFTGFAGTWNANTRTIYGNLTVSTGMTVGAGAPATTFSGASGTKTITMNGKTADFPIVFNGAGSTFSFADALTQGSTRAFTITNGTVRLKDGTTNTVGSFATGAGTTQRFLQSTAAGTQATISDASGANTATYLTIQDINATGGATWAAPFTSNNVNGGNNTGWNFGEYAASGLSRGVGLYAGQQGLWGGNSGLWGGFSGLTD
jgi:hypothetical protein